MVTPSAVPCNVQIQLQVMLDHWLCHLISVTHLYCYILLKKHSVTIILGIVMSCGVNSKELCETTFETVRLYMSLIETLYYTWTSSKVQLAQ